MKPDSSSPQRQARTHAATSGGRVRVEHPFTLFAAEDLERSIVERFERQVERHGDRTAVRVDDGALTYRELDRRANRVAGALLERLGDASEPVGLLFEHNAAMVTAVMGVLKAGMFYVPLDPRHPHDRLGDILRDCGTKLLLFEGAHAESASRASPEGVRLLDMDSMGTDGNPERPATTIGPDQPSYIIYTSGSTGQPKGVCHTQSSTLRSVRSHTNAIHIAPDDRLALLASYGFGQSISSILGALLNGAAVCPYDLNRRGVAPLGGWLRDRRITIYHSIASIFRALCATLDPEERIESLRVLKLAGETVLPTDVALFRKHFGPGCLLHTGLGATEAHIICQYFLDENTPVESSTVPIGYPAEGMEVLLWDESGHAVADGEVGEIIVRSRYLAAGYWRRPDLTRERFSIDPDDPAQRLYRTGDLGRRLADGGLVHMGRRDHQLSIRGQRVESAEVEAALSALGSVRESVVAARPDHKGEMRLVAYLVPDPDKGCEVKSVRSALAKQLPPYMVPSAYVLMDRLPRNPNGKVDRDALPAPERQSPDRDAAYEPPQTAVTRQLTEIWTEVLGLDRIGANEDFFDLGGTSLAAAQLVAAMSKKLGVELTLPRFLEHPTIAGIAEWYERGRETGRDLDDGQLTFVRLREGSGGAAIFLMGGEDNLWGLAALARSMDQARPAFAIETPEINRHCRSYTLEELATRCVERIKRVQPRGPYDLIGHCFGGWVMFETARRLEQNGERVGLLVMMECFNRRRRDQYKVRNVIARRFGVVSRLRAHGRAMSRHAGGRLAYLRERTAAFTESLLVDLGQSGYDLAIRRGWRLPRALQKRVHAHRRALTLYHPKPYAGSALLVQVRAEESSDTITLVQAPKPSESVWGEVLTGQVEELWINADRHQMWFHPTVQTIGESLNAHLDASNR